MSPMPVPPPMSQRTVADVHRDFTSTWHRRAEARLARDLALGSARATFEKARVLQVEIDSHNTQIQKLLDERLDLMSDAAERVATG